MKTINKTTDIAEIHKDWGLHPLSEIMNIIGGGTPKTSNSEYWNGDIPWLSVVDFGGGNRWVYNTEKAITKKGLEESSTKILSKGQLIISARGTVGEIAQLGRDMAFNQSCYGLNGKEAIVINDFLYYLIKFKVEELKRNTHGAVFDTITTKTFDQIDVAIPTLQKQRAIAKILSDLDEKIELNRQMNKTLEDIGKAIFKRWFVDFEFPWNFKTGAVDLANGKPYKSYGGHMVESELGEIPERWEISTVDDAVSIMGGSTPNTTKMEFWENGDIFWATPKDLSSTKSRVLLDTERKITKSGLEEIGSRLLPVGNILLSSRAPIGLIAINEIPVAINQGFIGIICDKVVSSCYFVEWIYKNMDSIKGRANGTTFQEISKSSFKSMALVNPNRVILQKYTAIAESMQRSVVNNTLEIEKLKIIRDSLLPKLMTGNLRVI